MLHRCTARTANGSQRPPLEAPPQPTKRSHALSLPVSSLATSALLAPRGGARKLTSTRLHVFKEPTTPKPVEAPRRPKSKLRPRDPSLYMERGSL